MAEGVRDAAFFVADSLDSAPLFPQPKGECFEFRYPPTIEARGGCLHSLDLLKQFGARGRGIRGMLAKEGVGAPCIVLFRLVRAGDCRAVFGSERVPARFQLRVFVEPLVNFGPSFSEDFQNPRGFAGELAVSLRVRDDGCRGAIVVPGPLRRRLAVVSVPVADKVILAVSSVILVMLRSDSVPLPDGRRFDVLDLFLCGGNVL